MNTSVEDILYRLKVSGIGISVIGTDLKLNIPDGGIDNELVGALRLHKEDIIAFVLASKDRTENEGYDDIPALVRREEHADRIPLTYSQQRLWFIDKLQGSTNYHLPTIIKLTGALQRNELVKALKIIIDRHQVFRTLIKEEEGELHQRIISNADWQLNLVEAGEINGPGYLDQFIKEEINRPFDLSEDFNIRGTLIGLGSETHILVLVIHHIASDGWSNPIFFQELVELYQSGIEKRLPELSNLEIQYADFALWQKSFMQSNIMEQQLAYWQKQLNGGVGTCLLPDYNKLSTGQIEAGIVTFELDEDTTAQLRKLSESNDATLFMVLLGVLKVLCYRYSHQEDICIGFPIANRNQKALEHLIGFFVNTLALRSDLSNNPSFTDFLSQLKLNALEAYSNQEVPFEKIIEVVEVEREVNTTPIFQIFFNYREQGRQSHTIDQLKLEHLAPGPGQTKFDIAFNIAEEQNTLHGEIHYNPERFSKKRMANMVMHFHELCQSITAAPAIGIQELDFLSTSEKKAQQEQWENFLATPEEKQHPNVVERFREVAQAYPNQEALIDGENKWTYERLDTETERIAHFLNAQNLSRDQLCFVQISSPSAVLLATLGVMKSGKIVVPIHPELPSERLKFLIQEYQPSWFVVDEASLSSLDKLCAQVETPNFKVCYHDLVPISFTLSNPINFLSEKDSTQKVKPKPVQLKPEDPCYITFTSGSTGKPKAILGRFKGLNHFINWELVFLNLPDHPRVSQFSAPTFDAYYRDLFVPLCSGGTICLPPRENGVLKTEDIVNWIETNHIHLVHCVPTLFREFLIAKTEGIQLPDLKYVLLSGEKLYGEDVKSWSTKFGTSTLLINLYGASETTLVKFHYEIDYQSDLKGPIPIGKPMEGSKAIILDENMSPVGNSIAGEIYIHTRYQTLGYYKDPELTRQIFLEHPASKNEEDTLYKTGDYAIVGEDGNYQFLGRKDNVVKVGGVRLDLGEIESYLRRHPEIEDAVTLYSEEKLIAFIKTSAPLDEHVIKQYLRQFIPFNLIPSIYVPMEKMPKTRNGKIDRQKLKQHLKAEKNTGKVFQAATTPTEEQLTQAWSEILDLESTKVSVFDSFFKLGGHSLKATTLVNRISKAFDLEVPLEMIFQIPTIRDLAQYIDTIRNTNEESELTEDMEEFMF